MSDLVGIESGIGPVQLFAGVGVALVLLVLVLAEIVTTEARRYTGKRKHAS